MLTRPVLESLRLIGEWRDTGQALDVAVDNLVIAGRNQDKLILYINHLRSEVLMLREEILDLASAKKG